MAKLAEQFELHPNQIDHLRPQAMENMVGLFAEEGAAKPLGPLGAELKVLHAKIGKPPLENDFLKGALSKAGEFKSKLHKFH